MPHYPKPFFRKYRQLWYVQIDGRQINLGPDRDAAFAQYRDSDGRASRRPARVPPPRAARGRAVRQVFGLGRTTPLGRHLPVVLVAAAELCPPLSGADHRGAEALPCAGMGRRQGHRHDDATELHPGRQARIKWAHRQGYIEANPLAELEAPSAERREVLISEAEYAQLLGAIRDPGFLRPGRHHLGNRLPPAGIAAGRGPARRP